MHYRELTTKQKAQLKSGTYNVSEDKIIAVLNALVRLGDKDVIIQGKTLADISRVAAMKDKEGASVSHAIRYLQWAKYIDVAQDGQKLAYFVRFPIWKGLGLRIQDCHFPDGARIWGFPFRYGSRADLFNKDMLDMFNGFTQFRKKRKVSGYFVDVTQGEIREMANNHCRNDMSSKRARVAIDCLNTWNQVKMFRRGNTTVYNLGIFSPGTPGVDPELGGFNYHEVPWDVPLPDPGYLAFAVRSAQVEFRTSEPVPTKTVNFVWPPRTEEADARVNHPSEVADVKPTPPKPESIPPKPESIEVADIDPTQTKMEFQLGPDNGPAQDPEESRPWWKKEVEEAIVEKHTGNRTEGPGEEFGPLGTLSDLYQAKVNATGRKQALVELEDFLDKLIREDGVRIRVSSLTGRVMIDLR